MGSIPPREPATQKTRKAILLHDGLPSSDMLSLSQQADQRGFDGIFLIEECAYSSLAMLGAIATATKRALIGTCIASVYTRSAPIYAMSINTLNDLSGGRAVLGLGLSPPYFVKYWHDSVWNRPVGRMKDYIRIVRKILAGGPTEHAGNVVNCREFQLAIDPPKNKIPLYFGAIGPQMITAAGEVADGVMLSPLVSEEYLEFVAKRLKEGAAKAKRDPNEIDVAAPVITAVHPDEKVALEWARCYVTYFSVVFYYDFLLEMSGFGALRRKVAEVNKKQGFLEAVKHVSDDMVRKVAVAGTPEQCKKRIRELRQAGLAFPILNAPGPRIVFGQQLRVPVDNKETCGAVVKYLADS